MAQISSLELLSAEFRLAGPKSTARAKTVLRKAAKDVQATAQSIAPVKSGNLKSSITTSDMRLVSAENMFVEVGPTANYGGYVELGTSRQAPQAYMGPAMDQVGPGFAEAMAALGEESLG